VGCPPPPPPPPLGARRSLLRLLGGGGVSYWGWVTSAHIKLRPMSFQRAQLRLARKTATRLIQAGLALGLERQRREGGCGGLRRSSRRLPHLRLPLDMEKERDGERDRWRERDREKSIRVKVCKPEPVNLEPCPNPWRPSHNSGLEGWESG
jgi:hypothetical protein